MAKNTAPAIAVAALRSLDACEGDCYLLVLPADHLIADTNIFATAVQTGLHYARQGMLVTFGIVPSASHTGYGYIHKGDRLGEATFLVDDFVEKPSKEIAESYLASGEYYWNSGMFLFSAKLYLDELERLEPAIVEACSKAMNKARRDLDFLRLNKEAFESCPSDSIDYAVMEKTERAVVVGLDCGWRDIGSWASLWESSPQDDNGNVIRGDVIAKDVQDSLLMAEHRLIAILGARNLVVVETPDAILIANKEHSQDVKKIVQDLKDARRTEFLYHSRVYRPWGFYERLVAGDRFQVKLIEVKPGAKLSVQMHHHRAEHWIIVKGTAKVQRGDETMLFTENESTYIPVGTIHSLENPGKIPLELIEVQSGAYLGEDDIVRLENLYGRAESL